MKGSPTSANVAARIMDLGELTVGLPWLTAGITTAIDGADFGMTTSPSAWHLSEDYENLSEYLGFESVVVLRQVHGREIRLVSQPSLPGLTVLGVGDGMVAGPGPLLAVTAADCVPVFLADEQGRAIGLLHAGWRGVAAGVLPAGLDALRQHFGVEAGCVRLHLGPAICGRCYEVGPEVLAQFGKPVPSEGRDSVDLRAELAGQAEGTGVDRDRISISEHCTRCEFPAFHSHRGSGGSAGRMAAFLGVRGCSGP